MEWYPAFRRRAWNEVHRGSLVFASIEHEPFGPSLVIDEPGETSQRALIMQLATGPVFRHLETAGTEEPLVLDSEWRLRHGLALAPAPARIDSIPNGSIILGSDEPCLVVDAPFSADAAFALLLSNCRLKPVADIRPIAMVDGWCLEARDDSVGTWHAVISHGIP